MFITCPSVSTQGGNILLISLSTIFSFPILYVFILLFTFIFPIFHYSYLIPHVSYIRECIKTLCKINKIFFLFCFTVFLAIALIFLVYPIFPIAISFEFFNASFLSLIILSHPFCIPPFYRIFLFLTTLLFSYYSIIVSSFISLVLAFFFFSCRYLNYHYHIFYYSLFATKLTTSLAATMRRCSASEAHHPTTSTTMSNMLIESNSRYARLTRPR